MDVLGRVDEDIATMIGRGRFMGETLNMGPNWVHAVIGRGDTGAYGEPGTFEDLGWAHNLRTTTGMTWLRGLMGGVKPVGTTGVNTSVTANSWTNSGAPFTASQLTGMVIVSPITGLTTQPVYGNILSNTTTAIQIDQWWTQAEGVGTTPATGNAALILPGQGPARFMALTTNTGVPAIGDTALTGEFVTLGLNRAISVYADTGATTFTQYKIWTSTGDSGIIHKAGLFSGGYGASGGGVLVATTDLNAEATLANNDTLAVTWTWTLPTAGT
jgi:hypothetical protein